MDLSLKINPELSFLGGQSFVWKKTDSGFLALHSDFAILLRTRHKHLRAEQVYGQEIDIESFLGVRDLDDFLASIVFSQDTQLQKAHTKLGDLLVISQPIADTFFSFLLSSNNNISRIRSSVACLSSRLGQKVKLGGENHFLFPSAEQIAQADLSLLYECGAGYRAEYIKQSAQKFLKHKDELEKLKGLELIERLKSFKGIGDKVADCVAVFSGKADEFSPVDRWAKRAILNTYGKEFKKYDEYRNFLSKKFGKHAKFAGQYLFEYERLKLN